MEQLCWPWGLAVPSSLEQQVWGLSRAWLGLHVGCGWLQHWRRGGGDTEYLDYVPSQTQDPPTAPQTAGAARWSMTPTSRVSDQTRDLPEGLGHSSGLAIVKLGEREGVHQRLLPTGSHTQKHTQTQDAHRLLKTRTHKHIQTHKRQQATTRRFTNTITHRNIWKHKTDTYTNNLHINTQDACACRPMNTHRQTYRRFIDPGMQTHKNRCIETSRTDVSVHTQTRRSPLCFTSPRPSPPVSCCSSCFLLTLPLPAQRGIWCQGHWCQMTPSLPRPPPSSCTQFPGQVTWGHPGMFPELELWTPPLSSP